MTTQTQINWQVMDLVILTAEAAIEVKADGHTYNRWRNALKRAVAELRDNPRIAYDNGGLILLSEKSNELYVVEKNGFHVGCGAFDRGFPCHHRCIRRLLDLYEAAMALPVMEEAEKAPRTAMQAAYGITQTATWHIEEEQNAKAEQCAQEMLNTYAPGWQLPAIEAEPRITFAGAQPRSHTPRINPSPAKACLDKGVAKINYPTRKELAKQIRAAHPRVSPLPEGMGGQGPKAEAYKPKVGELVEARNHCGEWQRGWISKLDPTYYAATGAEIRWELGEKIFDQTVSKSAWVTEFRPAESRMDEAGQATFSPVTVKGETAAIGGKRYDI